LKTYKRHTNTEKDLLAVLSDPNIVIVILIVNPAAPLHSLPLDVGKTVVHHSFIPHISAVL
jgi:hypothetical protein